MTSNEPGDDHLSLSKCTNHHNYPGPKEVTCDYILTRPYTRHVPLSCEVGIMISFQYIELQVVDMDIERCTNCKCDKLQVHDGQNETFPSLLETCGKSLPNLIVSTQQVVHVMFTTDRGTQMNGFKLQWQSYGMFVLRKLPFCQMATITEYFFQSLCVCIIKALAQYVICKCPGISTCAPMLTNN